MVAIKWLPEGNVEFGDYACSEKTGNYEIYRTPEDGAVHALKYNISISKPTL